MMMVVKNKEGERDVRCNSSEKTTDNRRNSIAYYEMEGLRRPRQKRTSKVHRTRKEENKHHVFRAVNSQKRTLGNP